MFERYTEKARRVIFFARYEASSFGSPYIESEHMLLGLLREDRNMANRFLKSHAAVESIRRQIEERSTVREKLPTSVDLPLSLDCKRVLAFGVEESERLGHKHIGTAHLLAGLMREENCFGAQMLQERGLELAKIREWLVRDSPEEGTAADGSPGRTSPLTHGPQIFNLPFAVQAELTRQAQSHGVEVQPYLLSLIESALHQPISRKDAGQKEVYQQLRSQMEASGLTSLDTTGLKEEIARRKGTRPQ